MTEEQIRAIVRDQIEEEALKEGGLYDECRQTAFNMTRAVIESVFKNAVNSFSHAHAPAREEPAPPENEKPTSH